MLALVMCLLVLGFAGAAVLHDASHEWPSKRTATERAPSRAGRREPETASRPAAGPTPVPRHPARRLRAGVLLVFSAIGVGVVTGVGLGLVVVVVGFVLRSI